MGNSDELQIVIRAVDKASQVLYGVRKELKAASTEIQSSGQTIAQYNTVARDSSSVLRESAEAIKNTTPHANALERQWGKLTSATNFAAGGLVKLNKTLKSIVWGSLIGLGMEAGSVLVSYAVQALTTKDNIEELNKAINDQATAWGLLPDKLKGATEATINLYNAELDRAQFLSLDKGEGLKQQVKGMEARDKLLQSNIDKYKGLKETSDESDITVKKWLHDWNNELLNNKVTIAEVIVKQEQLNKLMNMKHTTPVEVKTNLSKDKPKAKTDKKDPLKEYQSLLERQYTELADHLGKEKGQYIDETTFINEQLSYRLIAYSQKTQDELAIQQFVYGEKNRLADEWKDKEFKRIDDLHDKATKSDEDLLTEAENAHKKEIALQERKRQTIESSLNFITRSALAKHKEFFLIMKAANMAQAYMDTMVAATRALAEGGPFLGPILAAAIKVAGFANIAAIASESFSGGGGGGGAAGSATSGMGGGGQGSTFIANQPAPMSNVQIIVHGNIIDHAAFVRELQPYFKEVKIDTL